MLAEFTTVRVTSGTTPGPALEDMMTRVTSPLLLVSAGPPEKPAGDLYDRAAGDRPVEHWHLPDVGHTAAIREAAPAVRAARHGVLRRRAHRGVMSSETRPASSAAAITGLQ